MEVRFKDLLAASVQYTLLTRYGLDPADYLEDGALSGITAFSTPAVLHHLGTTASVSINLLQYRYGEGHGSQPCLLSSQS